MVHDVVDHMRTTPLERGVIRARELVDGARGLASATLEAAPSFARDAKIVARELGEEAIEQLQQRVPLDRLPLLGSRLAARG